MSGLLFLTADDFHNEPGTKGQIMCHNIQNYSLILFYSTKCRFCKDYITVFRRLPGTVGGCHFGLVNLDSNQGCLAMSRQTIAPIDYVPYIVLYVQGKPFMVYKGPANDNEIRRFIVEIAENIQKRQQFAPERVTKKSENSIPEYSLGKPVSGGKNDMVCYVNMIDAYKNQQPLLPRGAPPPQ